MRILHSLRSYFQSLQLSIDSLMIFIRFIKQNALLSYLPIQYS